MFDQKVELETFDKQDPEYQHLLRRVLTIQSDCEIGGPHLYVEYMLGSAPSRVDQLVVARTAAEEVDHFRKMTRLAGDLGVDTAFLLTRPNRERYLDAFRGMIKTWEDFCLFGFLIDRVGYFQLDEFLDCSYAPLTRILPPVLAEEEGHLDFGTTRTAELAARGGEAKERIQKSLDYWYPKSLDSFGMSDSERSERFQFWGLKRRTNRQQREEFIAQVNPMIEQMGLAVPDPSLNRVTV